MRKYELTYLVSDEVPENDLNKVTGKVTGFINDLGGKLTKEDIWGRRKLAYPIRKQDFATYVTLYFDLPAEKASEFERDLRHIDGVLRQLMIVKELGDEKITLNPDEIADATEIQNVVGGERSFEAIEGETEGSKDLMAKREDNENTKEATEVKTEEPVVKEKKETAKKDLPASTSALADAGEGKKVKEEKAEPKADTVKEEAKAEPKVKKTAKKKEEPKVNDEVERLSKLNDELDDILKDEL